jgi:hypothetical protein
VHTPADPTNPAELSGTLCDTFEASSEVILANHEMSLGALWSQEQALFRHRCERDTLEIPLGQCLYVLNPTRTWWTVGRNMTQAEAAEPIPFTTIAYSRMPGAGDQWPDLVGYNVSWWDSQGEERNGFSATLDHRAVELYEGTGFDRELAREMLFDGCEAILKLMGGEVRCFIETWDPYQ